MTDTERPYRYIVAVVQDGSSDVEWLQDQHEWVVTSAKPQTPVTVLENLVLKLALKRMEEKRWTNDRLVSLRAAAEAATPGEWWRDGDDVMQGNDRDGYGPVV